MGYPFIMLYITDGYLKEQWEVADFCKKILTVTSKAV